MWHLLTGDGLKPDPSKVEAIQSMSPPQDKAAVERLRGTVNYLSRFLPNVSDVMRPIYDLPRPTSTWAWDTVHEEAFAKMKCLLTQAPVLAYFNPTNSLTIQYDASGQGLGAAFLQDGSPLAYASRALSEAESRYATIAKEMLAIIFALEKWHQYTFGRPVFVYSDHKPLESITKKPLDRAPKRLQGMLMRALAYDVEVRYRNGKNMYLADTLSRAYPPRTPDCGQDEFETINALSYLIMPEEKVDMIRRHTNEDISLQQLKYVIQEGWPANESSLSPLVAPYFSVTPYLQ